MKKITAFLFTLILVIAILLTKYYKLFFLNGIDDFFNNINTKRIVVSKGF
ncbi:MAG: hypothetical protein R2790_00875 [Flavobacterium haoranii]